VLKARFVTPEQQVVAGSGLEVGLQSLDQPVVLVAHGGMRVVEDGLSAGRNGLVGEVQRCRVLVNGTYDHNERVKDMSANGVLGSLCFPSFPQFCGQLFARTQDKDVALAMVRAYNDCHIDEWCGAIRADSFPVLYPRSGTRR